jgi:hypothetical protein
VWNAYCSPQRPELANSLESADNRAIVVFVSSDLDLAKDHRFERALADPAGHLIHNPPHTACLQVGATQSRIRVVLIDSSNLGNVKTRRGRGGRIVPHAGRRRVWMSATTRPEEGPYDVH